MASGAAESRRTAMALGGWRWGLQLSPRSQGPSAVGIPGAHSFLPTYAHCHPFSSIVKLRIRPYHMNVRETQGNPSSFQSIEPTFKISDCDRIFALQKLFPMASVSSVNIKSELWKANIVHLKSLPSTQILLSSLHCLHQTLRGTQGPVLGRRGRRTVNSRPTWAT